MDNELWRTDDLALATYLGLHLPIVKTEWDEDRRCHWYFERSDDLEDYVVEWQFGDPAVNAREYADLNNRLKKQMFEIAT